jgi:potassium/hydrogen antiporter
LISLALAIGFSFFTEQSFRVCLINAIPLAVISSAIAIPSAARLPKSERDFVIYESAFSDVIGVMLYSLLIETDSFAPLVVLEVGGKIIAVLLLCLISILLLAAFMDKVVGRVRHLPVIAALILVYAIGGLMHLPALLIILAFGLYARNLYHPFFAKIMKKIPSARLHEEMGQLHQLTAEAAFFVRSVFFVFLGFSVELADLNHRTPWLWAGACMLVLILLRVIVLRILMKREPLHSLPYMMPRGLITILLFINIPEALKLQVIPKGMMLIIVLLSVMWMSVGLWNERKTDSAEAT